MQHGSRVLLIPKFEVKTCPHCRVNAIVFEGDTWQHTCEHRFMWLLPRIASCTICDWHYLVPVGRHLTTQAAVELFTVAHRRMVLDQLANSSFPEKHQS